LYKQENFVELSTVEQLIRTGMPDAEVMVTWDGSHFEAIVVSDAFAGKSLLQKQRMVMATVNEQVASGELHALSIKTFTPEEWSAKTS
jgi:acid stress-induced BolA-like protein IbaG/YrbA